MVVPEPPAEPWLVPVVVLLPVPPLVAGGRVDGAGGGGGVGESDGDGSSDGESVGDGCAEGESETEGTALGCGAAE